MGDLQGKMTHTLTMNQRKQAVITGVTDVCSFHENEIVLKIDGNTMVITGDSLHVGKLLLEEGRVDIQGHVDGISYEAPRLTGRMFRFGKKS